MLAKLLECKPAAAEERHEIAVTKEEFLLGRGDDCDLRLRSKAISRHHCLLRIRGGHATLTDLGSANGTFVNDQRVRSQAALNHGDEIALGEFRFILEMQGVSGIDWGPLAANDPQGRTMRVRDIKRTLEQEQAQKDESHPPGGAGG
jgi:pSer/pThr/pTyr-binding forkhead associated (FHA) protein